MIKYYISMLFFPWMLRRRFFFSLFVQTVEIFHFCSLSTCVFDWKVCLCVCECINCVFKSNNLYFKYRLALLDFPCIFFHLQLRLPIDSNQLIFVSARASERVSERAGRVCKSIHWIQCSSILFVCVCVWENCCSADLSFAIYLV